MEIDSRRDEGPFVGKVLEILQIAGFSRELMQQPDIVLILLYRTSKTHTRYYMPRLVSTALHILATYSVKLSILFLGVSLIFLLLGSYLYSKCPA